MKEFTITASVTYSKTIKMSDDTTSADIGQMWEDGEITFDDIVGNVLEDTELVSVTEEPKLVRELIKEEPVPFDKISISLLKSLEYGQDIELDDNYSLSHHSEEDMIDIFHTETWTDVYQVVWNKYQDGDDINLKIDFEQVFHNSDYIE